MRGRVGWGRSKVKLKDWITKTTTFIHRKKLVKLKTDFIHIVRHKLAYL